MNLFPGNAVAKLSRRMSLRVARAFALFTGALCALLLLSSLSFLPHITQISRNGEAQSPEKFLAFFATLEQSVAHLQERRTELVFPTDDSLYASLLGAKLQNSILSVLQSVESSVLSIDSKRVVLIDEMTYREGDRTLVLRGDVRGVGLRSMTVLAEFVDSLGRLPDVRAIENPTFTREGDSLSGFHSPFTITLSLR